MSTLTSAITPSLSKPNFYFSFVLTLITALCVTAVVISKGEALAAFGQDLPLTTRIVLNSYFLTWLLPLAVLAIGKAWSRLLQPQSLVLAIGIASIGLLLPLALLSVYSPLFRLAATI